MKIGFHDRDILSDCTNIQTSFVDRKLTARFDFEQIFNIKTFRLFASLEFFTWRTFDHWRFLTLSPLFPLSFWYLIDFFVYHLNMSVEICFAGVFLILVSKPSNGSMGGHGGVRG